MFFTNKVTMPSNEKEFKKYLKKKKYTIPNLDDYDTHQILQEDKISMSVRKVLSGQTYGIIISVGAEGVPVRTVVPL